MADRISAEHRSWNMSRIRGKNTKPELVLRSLMHRAGFRYRLHDKMLPGKPDIVLPKYKTAIFVNGCYWHRHWGCSKATTPKTNTVFWTRKFEETVERDARKKSELIESGWRVVTVWECELENDPVSVVEGLRSQLKGGADG
ncbi:very short patch repair endonuclease [Ruegeria arenilitoris]|uniref:very short patch repair endonuclease n=1 Tax=Ruegeria arenilitoris TaxID=1173585 RepID=UPI00147C7FE5|nr:very short patch repair endonuclease [Ruegeria arenilitoris]